MFEHAHAAFLRQAQGAAARERQRPVVVAPVTGHQPQNQHREHRQHRREGPDSVDAGQPQAAGIDAAHQINGNHGHVLPGRNRVQAPVDHHGTDHGGHAQRHQRNGQDFLCHAMLRKEQQGRRGQKAQHGQNAFAREPGTAPLRECAPGAFAPAQMQGRAEQTGNHEQRAHAERDVIADAEVAVVPEQGGAEPEPQTVTGAGQRAEKNDGQGGMHQRLRSLSSQRRAPGSCSGSRRSFSASAQTGCLLRAGR